MDGVTSHRGITRSDDIRLKQGRACALVNDCATCEYAKECREEDDRYVELSLNRQFKGRKKCPAKGLGSP